MKNNQYTILLVMFTCIGSLLFSACHKDDDFTSSKRISQKFEIIDARNFPTEEKRARFEEIMMQGFNFYEFASSQSFMEFSESSLNAFRHLKEHTREFVYTGCRTCTWDEFLIELNNSHTQFMNNMHAGAEEYSHYFTNLTPSEQLELFDLVDYIIADEYYGVNGFCYTVKYASSLGDVPEYYHLLRNSAAKLNRMNNADLIYFIHPITDAYVEELQETTQISIDQFLNFDTFDAGMQYAREYIFPAFTAIEERGEEFSYDLIRAVLDERGVDGYHWYEWQIRQVAPHYDALPINLKVEQNVICAIIIAGESQETSVKELFWWWMNYQLMCGTDQEKIDRACWDYMAVM